MKRIAKVVAEFLLYLAIAMPIVALLIGLVTIVNAFLISTVWGWLVVPLFGLHALTLGQAFAFGVCLNVVHGPNLSHVTADNVNGKKAMITLLTWYPMTLLIAWLARHFV